MWIFLKDLSIEVKRKPIKTLRLSVRPPDGEVCVSVPLHVPRVLVEEFVTTKIEWIQKQRDRMRSMKRSEERHSWVSGEVLFLLGKPFLMEVRENAPQNMVTRIENKVFLQIRETASLEDRSRLMKEWYRDILKQEIERLLPKWETITGLHCLVWRTKVMKTRWGSCNPTAARIWLNVKLAEKPLECLEYVLLHELLHLRQRGHGAPFSALMDVYMPNWRDIRRRLNA